MSDMVFLLVVAGCVLLFLVTLYFYISYIINVRSMWGQTYTFNVGFGSWNLHRIRNMKFNLLVFYKEKTIISRKNTT